jgi:peptide chain release factor subunit 1
MVEVSIKVFVSASGTKIDVEGIVIAGQAELKHELYKLFDKRLREKVLRIVDVQYGMRKGLSEALTLTSDLMNQVKLVKEQELLQRFMTEIANDGLCSYGKIPTMEALEQGAVDILICWEDMPLGEIEKYTEMGIQLALVSDRSDLGSQFVKSFEGIGAILRFKVGIQQYEDGQEIDEEDWNEEEY